MPISNSSYNPKLQTNAYKLRYTMTKAESCLWKYVLKAKMTGYTFNRQRPVLKYVADFLCKELKLIIEVDGYSHSVDEILKKDAKKQGDLEKAGFTVIRFTDEEVLTGIENVRRGADDAIEKLSMAPQQPPPPSRSKASETAPSSGGQNSPLRNKI